MSEYNNFLKHFNKIKNSGSDDASQREDIIPVNSNLSSADTEKSDSTPVVNEEQQKMFDENSPAEAFETVGDFSDTITEERFIKTNTTEFISVKGETVPDVPTSVEKYTDRLSLKKPEKKKHTGYTGKINTYAANHSPSADAPKFIPANEEEKQMAREKTKLKQTPEKTAEAQTRIIPTLIETKEPEIGEPKVIIEKLPENETSDKTKVINSKGNLLRQIAKTSGTLTEEDEQQLTMEGFEELSADNPVVSEDENILEKELTQAREKRINNFRFWSKQNVPTGESEDESFSAPREDKKLPSFISDIEKKFRHLNTDFVPTGNTEYTDPAKRKEIFSALINIRKNLLFRTFAVGLLGVILLLINIITSISAAMHNGFFEVFGGNPTVYNSVNLMFLLLCGVLLFDDLKKGVFSVLKIRPKTDSALLFVYAGALIQNITAYFTLLKPESDYHMLSGAAILLCVPVLLSKIFYSDSTRHCFKAVSASSDKSYFRKVSDDNMRAQLLKDRSDTETNVIYAGKTRFISGFLKRCAAGAFSAQASSKIVAISMAISLIAGLIGLITSGSFVYAMGCLTLCAALSFPISSLVFTGYVLSGENSSLSVKSSFISSFSDAGNFCRADDIVLDGNELFNAEITNIACSKNVAKKQAEFCAAVLTDKTEGLLKKAFSKLNDSSIEKLPNVEGLVYEDKMGISAWISDCKVLLGTRDYLTNHNVELPPENLTPFILEENERTLFLSIEGHFAAVFAVRYSCNALAARSLSTLAENGTNILISINEPNITEEFAENLLSLPNDSLRIIRQSANEKFAAQKNTVTDSEDTGLVFSDSFDAFCRIMASAIKLDKVKKISKIIGEAGALAGGIFGLILVIAKANAGINGWLVMILQLLWILLGFVITPLLLNIPLKSKIHLPENLGERIKGMAKAEEREIYEEPEEKETDITEKDEVYEVSIPVRKTSPSKEKKEQTKTQPAPVSENAEINEENIFPAPPVFSDNSPIEFKDNTEQLIMQGAPYTKPPEVIDFNAITGLETTEDEGPSKQTVSDELLDSYASASERHPRTQNIRKKQNLFERIGKGTSDNSETEANGTQKKSILSFLDEKIPDPPKFDLSKKKKETENDPLKAKFIPPETDTASAVYNDDFFSSFDTKEDDKAFSDIRRKREEAESEGEFDFWTKR